MRGSEVLKCLEKGGKIRLSVWMKDRYVSGVRPPYIRSSSKDDSMISAISQLYDYEWEEYIPPKVEQPILSYAEALATFCVGDRIRIIEDGSISGYTWCTTKSCKYTGTIVKKYDYLSGGDNTSLLTIRLDKHPHQVWGLGKTCKVQKIDV